MFEKNEIRDIRPNSTFESFKPQTPVQEEARDQFEALADSLIRLAPAFNGSSNPLGHASMFVISGDPGTGKTHLLESFINRVKAACPQLLDQMYLLRGDFTAATMTAIFPHTFDNKPIILLDDLFSERQSAETLLPGDIKGLMNFIPYIYDKRCLVIATTNFPFLEGILPRIREQDQVGRITSRCQEIISAHSGEIKMDGPDYRGILAQQAAGAKPRFSIG